VEPDAADDYAANLACPMAALSYTASTFRQVTQTPVNVVLELRP
jgi:hypothetical protein